MKLFVALVLIVSVILTSVIPDPAAADVQSVPPSITGEAAYLIDVQSGQTLYSKNANEALAPASTTKIMTGLLAIEKGNLDDQVTATNTLLNNKLVYGTQIYLTPGETLSLRDLLYALFLNSANDAAVTIAEHIGGNVDNFVDMMNERAKQLGATNTHFLNPSGLTQAGHVSTAHDLAVIARAAYQNPVFADFVRTKTHVISRAKPNVPTEMINENKLLWRDDMVNGIKTGYTAAAENCLVASATKDGRQEIGVILKSPGGEIYNDMIDLLNYGFDNFDNVVYKPAGTKFAKLPVAKTSVNLVIDQPIYVTVPTGAEPDPVQLRIIPPKTPLKSVEAGQTVATLEEWQGDQLLNRYPLKSASSVQPILAADQHFSPPNPWLFAAGLVLLFLTGSLFRSRWPQPAKMRRKESH